jgi:UDP:flavonoid glycosyltransferase YjiC (YdhE family)
MSRFLFVVPPVAERAWPARIVGRVLSDRGHDVVWVGHPRMAPDGAVVVGPIGPARAHLLAALAAGADRATGGQGSPVGSIVQWDDFLLPLARSMLPAVHAAIDAFAPDALVVDQQALAGAAAGYLHSLPWATIVPTSAGLADRLGDLPDIARRMRRRSRRFLREAGLDDIAAARLDPQASPHLVLAFSTEALAGPVDGASGRCALVGPCLAGLPDDMPFNWGWLDPARRLVVLALETPRWRRGARLYRVAAEALSSLAPEGVQGVIVGPPDLLVRPPANVLVVPSAPLRALVRRAGALVCDAGHRLVCEALVHGVPLVVAPMTGDQPTVAAQVVRAAAAVRVAPAQVDGAGLGRAVVAALDDRRIARGVERVRDSFAAAEGTATAADRLEALVGMGPASRPATWRARRCP